MNSLQKQKKRANMDQNKKELPFPASVSVGMKHPYDWDAPISGMIIVIVRLRAAQGSESTRIHCQGQHITRKEAFNCRSSCVSGGITLKLEDFPKGKDTLWYFIHVWE